MSIRLSLFNVWLRLMEKPFIARSTDPIRHRKRLEWQAKNGFRPVPGVSCHDHMLGPVEALTATPPRPVLPLDARILYLHGGGYNVGSRTTHQKLACAIARVTGWPVTLPEYRLAPEHPFPAAIDDAQACYGAMFENDTRPVVVMGESAGGGLSLALLHAICAGDLPKPLAVVALSPWADLSNSSESFIRNEHRDVVLAPAAMHRTAESYLGGAEATHPLASPVFGDFAGAPPVLIQVSAREILEDDAHRVAARLTECGVDVSLQTWDNTPHAWHLFHGLFPEADAALEDIRAFLAKISPCR